MYTKKLLAGSVVAVLTGATTTGVLSAQGAAHAAPCNSFVFSGPRQLVVAKGTPMGSPTLSFGGTGKEFNPSPATLAAAAFQPVKGLAVGKIDGSFVEVAFINPNPVEPNSGIPQNVEFEGSIAADGTASGNVLDGTWTLQPALACEDTAEAPAPAKQAKSQPGVTSDTVIGGLVIHVMNNSDDTTKCHYDSEVVDRDFTLQPRTNTDLTIVPALPLFRDWNYSVTCDNDTSTSGRIFF
jgi:hypothetical protein